MVITLQADLEGKPDIIASLSVSPKSPPLVSVQMHSCVYVDESDESIKGCFIGRKIRFSPPTESFNLCNYISPMPSLPIKGIYEMKVKVSSLLYHCKDKPDFKFCYTEANFLSLV